MPKRDDKYVAALQLLLSDMDPRDRFLTYQAAFNDGMVFYSMTNCQEFEVTMQRSANYCYDALNRADGSSGLGVVAVQNLNVVLRNIMHNIHKAATDVGVKLKIPT
jgi:hypothetical protein